MKKILILIILFWLFFGLISAHAVKLTYKICTPNIWMGTVEWESKPGPHVKYKIREDLRLQEMGTKTFEVEPGWYGITVFDSKANHVKDYADILIEDQDARVEWCR